MFRLASGRRSDRRPTLAYGQDEKLTEESRLFDPAFEALVPCVRADVIYRQSLSSARFARREKVNVHTDDADNQFGFRGIHSDHERVIHHVCE
jgi:hypothetical protein